MILCYHGVGLIGAAIRYQTRGPYSHAAWMLNDGSVIEAWQNGGVRHNANPFTLHGPDATFDVYSIRDLSFDAAQSIEGFLRLQLGAGYDFLGVLRFLSGINRNNYNRWFCSELVAEACEEAGRPLLNTDAWRISPSSLAWSTELKLIARKAGRGWWNAFFEPLMAGLEAPSRDEELPEPQGSIPAPIVNADYAPLEQLEDLKPFADRCHGSEVRIPSTPLEEPNPFQIFNPGPVS